VGSPLGVTEVAIRELLALEEHLNDPVQLVPNVNVTLLNLVLLLRVNNHQKTDLFHSWLSVHLVLSHLDCFVVFSLDHHFVHRVQDLHASISLIVLWLSRGE